MHPRDRTIHFRSDGVALSPGEYARLLTRLAEEDAIAADEFSLGGAVERLERRMAETLGKEMAVFMPSGTMANHLALRLLARRGRRVLVQRDSHIYCDCGDCAQELSGLTLVPLAAGRTSFTFDEVAAEAGREEDGRVRTPVGAISIESPVRRRYGELFDRSEMIRVCTEARRRGIGLHLDGARMFIASAYTGIAPAEYAAPFDTVYVSLWKCFNSINGAILAGPAATLEGMVHTRRMFGGALFNAWPFALLAKRYAEGFVGRFTSAITVFDQFQRALAGGPIRIERITNGTNVFRLSVNDAKADALPERMRAQGVIMPAPTRGNDGAVFVLNVNETWNRTTGQKLADQIRRATAG